MKTITIPQKQSNTGSIMDLESEHCERVITFKGKEQFAVVLPPYYATQITNHRTEEMAVKVARKFSKQSYRGVRVIDSLGNLYLLNGNSLEKLEEVSYR